MVLRSSRLWYLVPTILGPTLPIQSYMRSSHLWCLRHSPWETSGSRGTADQLSVQNAHERRVEHHKRACWHHLSIFSSLPQGKGITIPCSLLITGTHAIIRFRPVPYIVRDLTNSLPSGDWLLYFSAMERATSLFLFFGENKLLPMKVCSPLQDQVALKNILTGEIVTNVKLDKLKRWLC